MACQPVFIYTVQQNVTSTNCWFLLFHFQTVSEEEAEAEEEEEEEKEKKMKKYVVHSNTQ